MEPCRAIPDPVQLGLQEWHAQVIERYVLCSVNQALCQRGLQHGFAE